MNDSQERKEKSIELSREFLNTLILASGRFLKENECEMDNYIYLTLIELTPVFYLNYSIQMAMEFSYSLLSYKKNSNEIIHEKIEHIRNLVNLALDNIEIQGYKKTEIN